MLQYAINTKALERAAQPCPLFPRSILPSQNSKLTKANILLINSRKTDLVRAASFFWYLPIPFSKSLNNQQPITRGKLHCPAESSTYPDICEHLIEPTSFLLRLKVLRFQYDPCFELVLCYRFFDSWFSLLTSPISLYTLSRITISLFLYVFIFLLCVSQRSSL